MCGGWPGGEEALHKQLHPFVPQLPEPAAELRPHEPGAAVCMYVLYFLLWFQHQLFCESGRNPRSVSEAQRKSLSILSESISGGITDFL